MNPSVFRVKKWVIYVLLVVTTLAIGLVLSQTIFRQRQNPQQDLVASSPLIGKPAPDFMLSTLDGAKVSLSQFRGQPVLINFWASWCFPCREEMPELVRTYEGLKAEGFTIIGVNLTYSDSLPDIQAFVNEFNITFPVLLDLDGTVAQGLYQMPGLPTSVFVNRDGKIARNQVGVMNGEQIARYVAEILK